MDVVFGVELEMKADNVDVLYADAYRWFGGYEDDASLGDHGIEFQTSMLHYPDDFSCPPTTLRDMGSIFEEAGAYVDADCGTHIHVSSPDMHINHVAIADYLWAVSPLMYALGGDRGVKRQGINSDYTRDLSDMYPSYLVREMSSERMLGIAWVHRPYSHFEIRAFSGTLDPMRLETYMAAAIGAYIDSSSKGAHLLRAGSMYGMVYTNISHLERTKKLQYAIDLMDWKKGGDWIGTEYVSDMVAFKKQVARSLISYTKELTQGMGLDQATETVAEMLGENYV